MYKLMSESSIINYRNYYINNEWLSSYSLSNSWSKNAHNLIEEFISKNNCILYGSRAIDLLFKYNQINTNNTLKPNDYDLYSTRPKLLITELYNIFKPQQYIYSLRCSFAKNHGTCTLYINEIRFVDVTYVSPSTYDAISTYKLTNGIKVMTYGGLISSLACILADVDGVYMMPKIIDKLALLVNYFPFRFNIKELETSTCIFNNEQFCSFVIKLMKVLDRPSDIADSFAYVNDIIQNGKLTINKNEHSRKIDRIDKSIDNKDIEIINEQTQLPSFYRLKKDNITGYFFAGTIALYTLLDQYGTDIYINNNHILKSQLFSSLYDDNIDIFVENIDYTLTKIIASFKNDTIECKLVTPKDYPNMYNNAINININNKYSINLYELTTERPINNIYFKLTNNKINIACYMFLLSHLLLKINQNNKIKYSNILVILSNISNANQLQTIFRPNSIGNITIGNRKSILNSNENLQNDRRQDKMQKSDKPYKININYDLLV